MKQSKSRKKKSATVNPEILPVANLDSLLKWKALQLIVLGHKIFVCMFALKEYSNFPSDLAVYRHIYESSKTNQENTVTLIATKCADLNINTLQECFNYVEENIKKSKIYERQSLEFLNLSCWILGVHSYEKDIQEKDMIKFVHLEQILRNISCEAIGYWTAKLEEMKHGKNNAHKRTEKKEERKTKLREWMRTMKPKDYRLRAQKEFDITERTVLNWIQEIRSEKPPVLRKNSEFT